MRQSFQGARLEEILREQLPLARFMDVRVEACDDSGLVLSAAGPPNVNLHGTMFGGSIGALALLAGWGLLRLRLLETGMDPEIVIQRSLARYLAPIAGAARAVAHAPAREEWERFLKTLRRRRKARILLEVEVFPDGDEEADLGGEGARMDAWFVAVDED